MQPACHTKNCVHTAGTEKNNEMKLLGYHYRAAFLLRIIVAVFYIIKIGVFFCSILNFENTLYEILNHFDEKWGYRRDIG